MYGVACSDYLTSMHNGHGLWRFAKDSTWYHDVAVEKAAFLKAGNVSIFDLIMDRSIWPHVRWVSLMYAFLGSYPISFAPFNALIWLCTVFAVYGVAKLIIVENRVMVLVGTVLVTFMPTYLLQSTQLLKDPLFFLGISVWLLGLGRFLRGRAGSGWYDALFVVVGMQLCLIIRPYWEPVFFVLTFFLLVAALIRASIIRRQSALALVGVFLILNFNPFDIVYKYTIQGSTAASLTSLPVISTPSAQTEINFEGLTMFDQYVFRQLDSLAIQIQTKRGWFSGRILK